MLGNRDGSALARGFPDAEVLFESFAIARNGWLVLAQLLPDVVGGPVSADRPHERARRAVGCGNRRLGRSPVIEDVKLAQRADRPPVDSDVGQAAIVALGLGELRRDGAYLGVC